MRLTPAQNSVMKQARQHAGRGAWFVFSSYPQVIDALERRGLVTDVHLPMRGATDHSARLTPKGEHERRRLRGEVVPDASKDGMHRAADHTDAHHAVGRADAPLTFTKPRPNNTEAVPTGVKCRCGATSSQFTTRRAFKEHQEVCTA